MKSFDEVFSEYHPRILKLCTRIVKDTDDAKDCAQDTMVKAWAAYGRFEGKSNVYTWLYRIAVNTCRDLLVDRSKRESHISIEDIQSPAAGEDGNAPAHSGNEALSYSRLIDHETPDSLLEEEDLNKAVLASMNSLAEEFRTPMYLFSTQGLNYEQIADIMGVTVNTIRVRLYRARQRVQSFLDKSYGGVRIKQ